MSRILRAATALMAVLMSAAVWAHAPAGNELKQIIEEGNPAYVDWSTALGDRGCVATLYRDEGYRLLLIDLIDAPQAGIEQWALFDAGLSLAGLRFLSDLHYGRVDPAVVGHNVTIERMRMDIPAALAQLSAAVDVSIAVYALEPQFGHYDLLKRQLSRYRALAAEDSSSHERR